MANPVLAKGSKGFLSAGSQRVPIEIADYSGKAVHVRFPGQGLIGGSPWCWLDFEVPGGLARYHTQICAATYDIQDGLLLVRVHGLDRIGIREFARVPVHLPVTLTTSHGQTYEVMLVNVSSGGALIETDIEADIEFHLRDEVTVQLPLPAKLYTIGGQVVHVEQTGLGRENRRRYGVRFVEVDRPFLRDLFDFIWLRLTELFPMNGKQPASE
jgi:hypothetical protein